MPGEIRTGSGGASDTQPIASPTQSIAVLPFTNMSADEENEYFCDGLAEEILNALSKIDELKVAARTSAFSFKGKNVNISDIGETLSVKNVLEGSVRNSGNRLRISLQLVNATDGFHLWSERYDREVQDIFDLQDEITLAVVDALKLKLFGDEKAAVLKRYTDNTEAYELFLKGRYYSYRYTAEGWGRAIEFFEKTIEIQPDFAPAYAGMAVCWGCLWFFGIIAAETAVTKNFYAEGMRTGSVETLKKGFHQQAILCGYLGDELIAAPIEGLYEWVEANPAPSATGEIFECVILTIEVTGRVATAKVRETSHEGDVIDYFHLLNDRNRWSIVSKLWDAES